MAVPQIIKSRLDSDPFSSIETTMVLGCFGNTPFYEISISRLSRFQLSFRCSHPPSKDLKPRCGKYRCDCQVFFEHGNQPVK